MLDKYAQVSCLIVKTEQDLKLHVDFARDNRAPEAILEQIEKGEKIPFFVEMQGNNTRWTEWEQHLYPAEKIHCDHTYYCALVKKPEFFHIEREKLKSYRDYLEHIDVDRDVAVGSV